MTEFTVIGGGVIGLMIARQLALEGASVELLESSQPGREASWAGGGILSPLHPWRYPDPLLRLATRSQQVFKTLVDDLQRVTGIDSQWRRSGLLIVDGAEKEQALAWGQRWRMALQVVEGKALHECEPALSTAFTQGLFLPEIAQLRNPRLLAALKRHLQILEVPVLANTQVEAFTTRGPRLTHALTRQGKHPVNTAIICAGAWGAQLLATTGLTLPVAPVRGQMMVIKTPVDTVQKIILNGPRYLIPRSDGRVLVGSTIEHCGFDKQTTQSARQELQASAIAMAPGLKDWPVEHHWAGLRPGSPSGVPYIGPHPQLDNLYSAIGHFRNGLMSAPATAELMLDLLTHRAGVLDASEYDLANFMLGAERRADQHDS